MWVSSPTSSVFLWGIMSNERYSDFLKRLEACKKLNITPQLDCVFGKTRKIGRMEFTYWGVSQWYRWRWFDDHLDLGVISIYNINTDRLIWRIVTALMIPMRYYYHRKYFGEFSLLDSILSVVKRRRS